MANRVLQLETKAWNDPAWWLAENRKLLQKIFDLSAEYAETPFTGTGKPEPLKGNLKGYWSRRISGEHRLIYKVTDAAIILISCKGHYVD